MSQGNMMGGSIGFGLTNRRDLESYIDGRKTPTKKFRYSMGQIAPELKVTEKMAQILEIKAGDGNRHVNGERGEDGSYPLITWKAGSKSFQTKLRGWEMAIDEVEDVENNEIIGLQKYHSEQLQDTTRVFREKRGADTLLDAANYGTDNKYTIPNAASNWLTDDNAREQLRAKHKTSTLYTKKGLRLESLWLIIEVSFLEKLVEIDPIADKVMYNSTPVSLLPLDQQAEILRKHFGVGGIIPVAGLVNTASFEAENGPTFSDIWTPSKVIMANLSAGGMGWDDSFARTPWYAKGLKGKRTLIQTYPLPQNDQMRTRLKEYDGLYVDYENGFLFSDVDKT